MTSDGEVLLHGYAVKCDVAPSKTIRNPKVLSPIFADPWSRKMRLQILLPGVRSREIFLVSVYCIAEWACLHHVLAEVIKFPGMSK